MKKLVVVSAIAAGLIGFFTGKVAPDSGIQIKLPDHLKKNFRSIEGWGEIGQPVAGSEKATGYERG